MPAPLTDAEAGEFLDNSPGWMVLTTIGKDGFPHSVPLGYFRLGDEIYMGCRADTQKTKNIERNPRVSLLIESGTTLQDIKGLMIQGVAEVVTDPAELLRLSQEAARSRGTPEEKLPTAAQPGSAYVRIATKRRISWDYSQAG